jgi:hypothetical protein
MQFKIIRHRDKDGNYHEGHRVQCLRRVREVTPDFPEGKNVQRVVAKFDREARELPADVGHPHPGRTVEEWKEWRVKQDEEHLKSVAQFELDTLAERSRRHLAPASKRATPPPPPKTSPPSARKSGR